MKTLKKITATVLAVLIAVLAAAVPGFAITEESVKTDLFLYMDCNGSNFLYMDSRYYLKSFMSVCFYSVSDDGTRTLIKELNEEEIEALDDYEPVSVPSGAFVKGGNYQMEIINPKESTETDATTGFTGIYLFTYDDLLGGEPIFEPNFYQMSEGETIDVSQYLYIPAEYSGELTYVLEYDDRLLLPEVITYAEFEGTLLTGVRDGWVYVDVYDENGEFCDSFGICIINKEPSNIFELATNSAEILSEGLLMAVAQTGSNIFIAIVLVFLPVLIPFILLFGIIFSY